MPSPTRSAAALTRPYECAIDPSDEDHLPTSAWAAMENAPPKSPVRRMRKVRGVPEIAYTIPKALYQKAQNQQNVLTDAERELLISRGDLIGKTLARPTLLTETERYKMMDRPPPEVVRDRIQAASNGALSTVAELVAKATPDASGLNDAELDLMAKKFHDITLLERFKRGDYNDMNDIPGANEASQVWKLCEELGFVEEERVIHAAFMRQFHRDRERDDAAHLAVMAAKKAHANTPEALQLNAKKQAFEKELQDIIMEDPPIANELNQLILKVELESELGDSEKDELRRRIEEMKAQRRALRLKSKDIRDRLYKLGPPNPHKELAEEFATKQQAMVARLTELGNLLEGLQQQDDGHDVSELKGKIEECYAEWALIIQNNKVAKGRLHGETPSDVRPLQEHELQQEQIKLERRVITARIKELRETQQEMAEDDGVKDEIERQVQDKLVQHKALGEKSQELKELRLLSLGIVYPPEKDPDMMEYIEREKKKAGAENLELSARDVEKMLEVQWQGMKLEDREIYLQQALQEETLKYHNRVLQGRGPNPPDQWEDAE